MSKLGKEKVNMILDYVRVLDSFHSDDDRKIILMSKVILEIKHEQWFMTSIYIMYDQDGNVMFIMVYISLYTTYIIVVYIVRNCYENVHILICISHLEVTLL